MKVVEDSIEDDLGTVETGPERPQLKQYPFTSFGLQRRSFQQKWFNSFEWLEYSVKRNAAFCYACRLFGKGLRERKDTFSSSSVGFSNWKRALDSFREHDTTAGHKASMADWKAFKTSLEQGSIIDRINVANVDQISERREYLCRLVSATRWLGKQGIPFRGHDETESSENQGNFLELLNFLKEFDPFLQTYSAPSHSTYLSPASQNEMIKCCADEVTAGIICEMKQSKMYAVMADEARDGHIEQLAVCVRYIGCDDTVKEHFLQLSSLECFDAVSITEAIEQVLESNGLQELRCVAQAYDGAAVMSGLVGGVQALFRQKHPEAAYVHCYAHELNLVLCHTCRAVPEASDFFDTLESLYSYFSVSLVNHKAFMNMQKVLGLEKSELVQLSKTRWACQVQSVTAVIANLTAVLRCLGETVNPTAVGLLSNLSKLSRVYMLVMFKSLLSTTEGLHKYLQKHDIDLAQATLYKDGVLATLQSMRTDETAEQVYKDAKDILEANHLPDTSTSGSLRRKQRRLDDYVVESTTGGRTQASSVDELRCHIFFPCLDRMVSELKKRFCGVGEELMKGIRACHPEADDFLCEDSLALIAKHYKITLSKEEIAVAKQFLIRRRHEGAISDVGSVYMLLDPHMFPSLRSIFQVALTIPVSSCSCERSFSALRRLHTWLRRTMGEQRLNSLAVMAIERGAVRVTDHNSVIDRFATLKSRRYSLIIPSSSK